MRRLRIDRIIIAIVCLILFVFLIIFLISKLFGKKIEENIMLDLTNYSMEEIKEFAKDNKLNLTIEEKYNKKEKGKVISQSILKDSVIIP